MKEHEEEWEVRYEKSRAYASAQAEPSLTRKPSLSDMMEEIKYCRYIRRKDYLEDNCRVRAHPNETPTMKD